MYLLNCEKKRLDELINKLEKNIFNQSYNQNYNLNTFIKDFYELLEINKDANIDDFINYIVNDFTEKMQNILDNNLSLGLQVGLKNNFLDLSLYGGKRNLNDEDVNINTLFSIDSISKILTSIVTIIISKEYPKGLKTPLTEINSEYNLDATLEEILKFTTYVKTDERLEDLPYDKTIELLKKVKESKTYPYYYKYSDIGYMILRNSLHDYIKVLDEILLNINGNISYQHEINATGGKIGKENITPDKKGRDIIPPGHTGIYANIEALLDLIYKLFTTNTILNDNEKKILLTQPYIDPRVKNELNEFKISKNGGYQYTTKICGLYITPSFIHPITNYNKLLFSDMSELTTNSAIATAGTCGAWGIFDNIPEFGTYAGGILTNPYSYIEDITYDQEFNQIPNTPITFNQKGIIHNYQSKLNEYKKIITKYNLILLLLQAYFKEDNYQIKSQKLIKKM